MHTTEDSAPAQPSYGAAYSAFVLVVLLIANILNYADRQILGVLGEAIKRDLKISNAELGFLAGTSFVLFNGVIGLVMARVVDLWRRNRLLVIGVALWSAMTALCGFTTSFVQLTVARLGIGVGETSIGATGYSMLADIFPPRRRAFAFSVFLCGPFIGVALCMAVGGWVVQHWPAECGALGLCRFKGWQAAFLLFGLPGLVVAVLVGLIGEPSRGEAMLRRTQSRPLLEGARELAAIIPPFSVFQFARLGGAVAVRLNLTVAAGITAIAGALFWLTHDAAQWIAVAFGFYILFSWFQAMAIRDPDTFSLTAGSPAFRGAIFGSTAVSIIYGTVSFWSVPLAIRKLGMNYAEAGAMLGAASGVGALTGNLLGGIIADQWRRRSQAAAFYIDLISLLGGALMLVLVLTATSKLAFTISFGLCVALFAAWPPGINALLQELVTPTMRGRTAAIYVVVTSLIAASFGPYTVGKITDLTGSIRIGLSALFVAVPIGLAILIPAIRRLPAAHEARDRIMAA